MVDLTERRHSMLVLGSELSRELFPLSLLSPPWPPLNLLASVTRGPALSEPELLPEAVLTGPELSLSSLLIGQWLGNKGLSLVNRGT